MEPFQTLDADDAWRRLRLPFLDQHLRPPSSVLRPPSSVIRPPLSDSRELLAALYEGNAQYHVQ